MQEGEIAFPHQILRAREHFFCLGRETVMMSAPSAMSGRSRRTLRAELDGVLS
jgi:hypothetical protein